MRKYFALAACLVLLLLVAANVSKAAPDRSVVYVRNVSASISDQQIENALPAFQQALDQDFGPAWGPDPELVFIGKSPVPKGGVTITVTDSVSCFLCLGYHEVWRGVPRAFVQADENWEETFTHELFEMLADPYANHFNKVEQRFYLVEVADPVEADQYAYVYAGMDGQPVAISDFVLPSYYRTRRAAPYDHMGYVTKQLQVLKGGYISWWRDGWHQYVNAKG